MSEEKITGAEVRLNGDATTLVYRGGVYVRPTKRGVILRDARVGEEGFDMYLDNFAALVGFGGMFADGECALEITIRRLDVLPTEHGIFEERG